MVDIINVLDAFKEFAINGAYITSLSDLLKSGESISKKLALIIFDCNKDKKELINYLAKRYGENLTIDGIVHTSGDVDKASFSISDLTNIDDVYAVYIAAKDFYSRESYDFIDFVDIISVLRGPNGCPWDKAQTHESLRKYLIEESYEAIGAIDSKDFDNLCEELGDVLLQIVLHSNIAENSKEFTLADIVNAVSKKMISRHAHIFGDKTASNPEEVKQLWEEIKAKEKAGDKEPSATDKINEVAQSLSTLMYSDKIQAKAAKFGFDFEKIDDTFDKVKEELEEVREEVFKNPQNSKNIEEEVGDLLFSVVNLSRFAKVDADAALRKACAKFKNRFYIMEKFIKNDKKSLKDLTLQRIDVYWNRSKNQTRFL